MLFQGQTSVQGRAVVFKRTTNEQRLMRARPSDRWMKIGVGVLLTKHETFQSLIKLFSPRLLASGGGGFPVTFELLYLNLLNFWVIFSQI